VNNRSSIQNFQKLTGETRSYSTGKVNHLDNFVDWNRTPTTSAATTQAVSKQEVFTYDIHCAHVLQLHTYK
jgi:hypothetical protein